MFNMTPVILKNLMAPRATRPYPKDPRPPFPLTRGDLIRRPDACTFCGVCAARCPSQCLTVRKKTAEWIHDPRACVFCGTCAEACPENALYHVTAFRPPFTAEAIATSSP